MNKKSNLNKLVLTALFIAVSFIGSYIAIPGTTIALDSMTGFLGAITLGPIYGGIIGAIGHLFTSFLKGFPLSFPIHIVIALSMFITMIVFGYTFKALKNKNKILAYVISLLVGVLFNGPIATVMLMPLAGKGILSMIPILIPGAVVNILIALLINRFMPKNI